jgi:hypothetical protein
MLLLRVHRRAFQQGGRLFTVLMCAGYQADRGYGSGPYPVITWAEMRAGLDLVSTWALEQKVAAFSALGQSGQDLTSIPVEVPLGAEVTTRHERSTGQDAT